MKIANYLLLVVILLTLASGVSQAGWSGTEGDLKISYFPGTVGDYLSRYAVIASYGESDLYAAWVQGKTFVPYEIFFSKSTNNGRSWTGTSADFQISADDGEGSLVSGEHPVDIAVNSLGHIFVVWAESLTAQGFEVMLVKSTDGGSTWAHSDADFPISLIGGDHRALEPAIAVDQDDGLHVVWHQTQDNGINEICYGYSNDNGETWTSQSADRVISFPDGNHASYADIAVDSDNNIHVVWREQITNGDVESYAIHYGRKLAGETQFSSEAEDITIALPHRSATVPSIIAGPNNHIHVAYEVSTYDGDIYQGLILYTGSADGGNSWSGLDGETIVDYGLGDGYSTRDPEIAVSSTGGLAVVYAWSGEYPDTEPRVSLSFDNGATWSGNTYADFIGHWDSNDNRPGYNPNICISAGDTLHAIWNEDCMDEGGSSGYYEIMYSRGDTLAAGQTSIADNELLPDNFSLTAYPNPFNSQTVISFSSPDKGRLSLQIYNVAGQRVATLYDGVIENNYLSVNWAPGQNGCVSGVYFIKATLNNKAETEKILYIK